MRCPECVASAKTSLVYPQGSSCTLMAFSPYYDEEGKYHSHDGNRITDRYRCSEGHAWVAVRRAPCPTCGHAWEW